MGTTTRPHKWIKPQLTRFVDEAPTDMRAADALARGCVIWRLTGNMLGATRTGAHHMINRQAVDIAKLIGASKVISAAAHD